MTMRYEKGHKATTRQRILEVAARRFREEGIAAVGLAAVMADAGLTNGAFYTHFDSKEDLVRQVLEQTLQDQRQATTAAAGDGLGLEGLIRGYLTAAHRDHAGDGCPSAALLDEIARRPQATRAAYTHRLLQIIDVIAGHLDRDSVPEAQLDALIVFGSLVGTLQLARAVTDPELSASILERGVAAALGLAAVTPGQSSGRG